MGITEILDIVTKVVSIVVVIIGLAAFVLKKYISQFIKTKFSIQLEKENTKYKQTFLKELESYKSSLIRELENHKLEIDIKRSQALIYMQKKIEAYELIAAHYSPIIQKILAFSMTDEEYRKDYFEFMNEVFSDLSVCDGVSNKYDLYINTTKIKIHLAGVYKDLIHLFNENETIDDTKIQNINKVFSMIKTQMVSELLGEGYYDQSKIDSDNIVWKAFYDKQQNEYGNNKIKY